MSPRSYTLSQLAQSLDLPFQGDASRLVCGALPLESPASDCLSFSEKASSVTCSADQVGALIVNAPFNEDPGWNLLLSERPRVDFARALELLYPEPAPRQGVHPSAWIDPSAQVHPQAWIGPMCSIGARTSVAAGCQLVAQVSLGADCELAENNHISPGCQIAARCQLGKGNFLEPRVALREGTLLGDDNYLGAHCVLDGCQLGSGCRVDNLVFVGARSKIGDHCILVSQSLTERDVTMAPYGLVAAQAVVDVGVELAAQVQIAGRCWVVESVTTPRMALAGEPAVDYRQEMKNRALRARALQVYRDPGLRKNPGPRGTIPPAEG